MAKDILLNNDFDFELENGDIAIGESDNQDVDLMLYSNQGEWKNQPLFGANVQDYILSTKLQGLKKHIKSQLKADGKSAKKMNINNSSIDIQL